MLFQLLLQPAQRSLASFPAVARQTLLLSGQSLAVLSVRRQTCASCASTDGSGSGSESRRGVTNARGGVTDTGSNARGGLSLDKVGLSGDRVCDDAVSVNVGSWTVAARSATSQCRHGGTKLTLTTGQSDTCSTRGSGGPNTSCSTRVVVITRSRQP